MTTYAYQARPVIDPDAPAGSSLVKGATFQFFSYSDTSYSTPLTVTARIGGVPSAVSTMTSTDEGLLDEFSVEDEWRVWVKTGSRVVLIESVQGLAEAATAAQAAALDAQTAAETAADAAAAAAAAAVVPTNAAIDARIVGKADLDPSTGKVVASQLPAGTSIVDATGSLKGAVRLAGDLGGTADAPTVPGLADKANDVAVVHRTGAETVAGVKTFTSSPVVPDGSFPPAKLAATGTPDATSYLRGDGQWATPAGVLAASTTVSGLVELATTAETTAGTDATRAVTPAGLKAALDSLGPVGAAVIDPEDLNGIPDGTLIGYTT